MSKDVCAAPLAWDTLVDYWLKEQSPGDEQATEEHLFACGTCSATLGQIAALSKGIRGALGGPTWEPVVTQTMLDGLVNQGVRTLEVTIAPGQQAQVILPAEVELLVARLSADLAGVERIDVEVCSLAGEAYYVARDVVFEADRGEVLILCQRHVAVEHGAVLFRLRAVDSLGSEKAAAYAFSVSEE